MTVDILILALTVALGCAWASWLERRTRTVVHPEFATLMSAMVALAAGWLVLAAAAVVAIVLIG